MPVNLLSSTLFSLLLCNKPLVILITSQHLLSEDLINTAPFSKLGPCLPSFIAFQKTLNFLKQGDDRENEEWVGDPHVLLIKARVAQQAKGCVANTSVV